MPKRAMNPIAADTLVHACQQQRHEPSNQGKGTINAAGTRKTEHR